MILWSIVNLKGVGFHFSVRYYGRYSEKKNQQYSGISSLVGDGNWKLSNNLSVFWYVTQFLAAREGFKTPLTTKNLSDTNFISTSAKA